jgi:peroxiredoxin
MPSRILTFLFLIFLSASTENLFAQSAVIGLEVGDIAPNISMPDTKGEILSLYDLRGNIVLIHFWAAWCRPCRHENVELAELYKLFKDKRLKSENGFRIYSVSLDKTRENWLSAIEKDELTWKEHVSVLKGWDSPAAIAFDIRAIPAGILIDGNGKIVAKNPKIEQLQQILSEMSQ